VLAARSSSQVMPPKSRSRKRTRGGAASPSAAAAAMPAALDTSFDFLDNVPSPVTLLPSQGPQPTRSGAVTPSVRPPSAQGAAPPSVTDSGDPYAFLAKIPSQVTIPSVLMEQQSLAVTPSDAPAVPSLPTAARAPPTPITQPAALPTPSAGDSAFDFLDKVPSPICLPPAPAGQGADTVRVFMFI
jgi:hypothetical protein